MNWNSVDSPSGHIACTFLIFVVGVGLYVSNHDYGKEIIAGALGSLWTLLQVHKAPETDKSPTKDKL